MNERAIQLHNPLSHVKVFIFVFNLGSIRVPWWKILEPSSNIAGELCPILVQQQVLGSF